MGIDSSYFIDIFRNVGYLKIGSAILLFGEKNMGNDFTSGFLIEYEGKKRGLTAYYKVTETKVPNICPFCKLPTLKHVGEKMRKHNVYAVIDDQFARCTLFRWYYQCESCEVMFFFTKKRDAYGKWDEFSCNFVEKAIKYWLESDKTAIYSVAKEIGISSDIEYKFNDNLIKYFRALTKLPCAPMGLYRFHDGYGNLRGFIGVPNYKSEKMELISFIDDYSAAGIREALKNSPEIPLDVSMLMFDYAPGLLEMLNEFFPHVRKCINANNLHSQLCWLLHLLPNDAENNNKDLNRILPNYDIQFDANAFYEWLNRYKDFYLEGFKELIPGKGENIPDWKYGKLIGDFYSNNFRFYSTENIRSKIRSFIKRSKPASYETIVLKMLYGKKEYEEEFKEAIRLAMEEKGRTFDLTITSSLRSTESEYDF